jgi:hypothetical protein
LCRKNLGPNSDSFINYCSINMMSMLLKPIYDSFMPFKVN